MSEQQKKRNSLRKIAYAGVLAAFVFTGTELHVPTAIGHVNLGDLIILVSAYILGPFACIPAAAGSASADLIAGYGQYVLPTFLIKGLMGAVAGIILRNGTDGKVSLVKKLFAGIAAESIMIAGYFLFESLPFMYGVTAALGSVIPNLIQAVAAIIGAIPLMYVKAFEKVRL